MLRVATLTLTFALALVASCGPAPDAASPPGAGAPADLGRDASDAVTGGAGAVNGFVHEALANRREELTRYLLGDAPLHVLLVVGAALHDQHEDALLDPPRQLLVAEYLYARDGRLPGQRGVGTRATSAEELSLTDLHEALATSDADVAMATQVVLGSAHPGAHGPEHLQVLEFHVARAIRDVELEGRVAALLARGLLAEMHRGDVVLLFGPRILSAVAAAMRIPDRDTSVRELADRLGRAPAAADDATLAAWLEAWWADEGPYLYLEYDELGLPGVSGIEAEGGGMIGVDTWGMFAGIEGFASPSDRPTRWLEMSYDRRLAEARESLRVRRDEPDRWDAWQTERRAALGLTAP